MDEELRVIKPYGHLYTMYQDYYLLKPFPITGDSWEGDNAYRFLVTPAEPIAVEQKGKEIYQVYNYPRHVVTNSFTIEYCEIIDIHVIKSEEIEYEAKEIVENDEKEELPY